MATTYRADWVFSPQQPVPIRHGVITVHEGKILSVEPWDHEKVDVDLGESLVIPGLVNYHVHLDLGGLRGKLPPPKSFTDWLRQVIHYRRTTDPREWDQHIEAGIQESIRYGCTYLSDISVGGRSEPLLLTSKSGWDCRLELIGMSEERIELALQKGKAWLEKNTLPPHYFLSPHAPYTVSRQLLSRLLTLNPNTQAASLQVAMHVAETREEIELLEHHRGPFKALLEEIYKGLNLDVVSFLYGPMPTQPLGWFKKPITKVEDFKGLKYRTVGLSIDIFTAMGAAVNALPGGEIVAAMDRGLLDAAEFNNATSDKLLGFPDVSKVCMLQSFHQCSEQFEILFNKGKYNALPADLKAVIANAVQAASAEMSWKAIDRYSQDYIELQKGGVKFYKTPDAILQAQLKAWDDITKKKSAENPLFKKVLESMERFALRACRWQNDTNVDYRMAFRHATSKKA